MLDVYNQTFILVDCADYNNEVQGDAVAIMAQLPNQDAFRKTIQRT